MDFGYPKISKSGEVYSLDVYKAKDSTYENNLTKYKEYVFKNNLYDDRSSQFYY